jgi:hypothetical protein
MRRGFRVRGSGFRVLVVLSAALMCGCQHLPAGWGAVREGALDSGGVTAGGLMRAEPMSLTVAQSCAVLAGRTGAVVAREGRVLGIDIELRMRGAALAAERACRLAFPGVMKGRRVGAVCREALGGPDCTDAEALLAMMIAGAHVDIPLNPPSKGD